MSEADLIGKNIVDLGAANATILQQQLQEVIASRGELSGRNCDQPLPPKGSDIRIHFCSRHE